MPRSLLVLSGGHPYEAEPFDKLIYALGDWDVTHLIHPEAEAASDQIREADALLFYDMGGYDFADGAVTSRPPSEDFKRAIVDRFASGRGAVAMHHALAGWADWPEWAEMLGGRFLYQPGAVRGETRPDSGYRHDVTYIAKKVAEHPVLEGIPEQFAFTDELYLCPIFEDDITPLVCSDYAFTRDNFYSAAAAVAGEMFSNDGWEHPDGSNCVAWTKPVGAASLVYLQFGDGPATYADANLRRILSNELDFVARA